MRSYGAHCANRCGYGRVGNRCEKREKIHAAQYRDNGQCEQSGKPERVSRRGACLYGDSRHDGCDRDDDRTLPQAVEKDSDDHFAPFLFLASNALILATSSSESGASFRRLTASAPGEFPKKRSTT